MPARTIAAAASAFVSARSRTRGDNYFYGGRVSVVSADPAHLDATVRGSRRYDVTLTLEGTRLLVECTCPYFTGSDDPCKHIWATIRAADEQRAFRVPDGLMVDVEGLDDIDGGFDIDDLPNDDAGDLLAGIAGAAGVASGTIPARLTPAERQGVADRMRAAWAERRPAARPAPHRPPPPAPWQILLSLVAPRSADAELPRALVTGEIIYVADFRGSAEAGVIVVEVLTRDRKKSGDWAKPRALSLARHDLARLPDPADRGLLERLCGAAPAYASDPRYGFATVAVPSAFSLTPALQGELTPRLCESGRFFLRLPSDPASPRTDPALLAIAWDADPAEFVLRVTGDPVSGYAVDGIVRHGAASRAIREAMLATTAVVLWRPAAPGAAARLSAFDVGGAQQWIGALSAGPVSVPAAQAAPLAETLAVSDLARVECPDELRIESVCEPPRPIVRIARSTRRCAYSPWTEPGRLEAALTFGYGPLEVDAWSAQPVVFDRERRAAWRRDRDAERAAFARLQSLGVRRLADWQTGGTRLDLADGVLPALARTLIGEGWRVEAEGRLYRSAGALTLEVRSGVDWFELHGGVDFEGVTATLPALLAAARRGDAFVPLGDGTFGVLPEQWLARSGRLAAIGTPEGDHLRFTSPQAALLDAWLASQPAVSCDEAFTRAREALARFDGIAPADPPASFRGTLRDYQRDALGWFAFLRRFGFGGCLADEMGLGKTVMVLAMLDARRSERERETGAPRPSLIVVPRSLVFNWRHEAERFAPALRVLDLTGGARRSAMAQIDEHDLVLTTYGTLRRDIGQLKDVAFDYAILDEAQAIKNARTSAAKAARLVTARHRLALSGTPVENHLGELWSLFDFLNPGILGATSLFAAAGASGRTIDDETLALLARGLRPFILRRTKDQVASELPARTEQTIYCDLEPPQRALYDELRDHYRASLLGRVARDGLGRAKLQILEALLRLRQAACHPGLLDHARGGDASAKLDVLMARLQELVEDGRKVLVFSQFTSLLALLRARLDEAQLTYEYLDGHTRDRAARVRRFQENGVPLFLVSLKAGGLGLNLTAAEYVFLLDPWWNPAAEAQAIDRAHRIGQTRPVFAFRLIARDTVEEKVLELQATKRRLADAIIRADEGVIRDLRREDLELLLS